MTLITDQDEMRKTASELILSMEGLIVELGCADGNFVSFLSDKISSNNYIGIDILKEQTEKAREKYPDFIFLNLDICENLNILKIADIFCAFQVLEHIGTSTGFEDCEILSKLKTGTKVVFSVPNSPYKKRHMRWFELEGWKERYSSYIKFDYELTIQNPIKSDRRSFLFKGIKI